MPFGIGTFESDTAYYGIVAYLENASNVKGTNRDHSSERKLSVFMYSSPIGSKSNTIRYNQGNFGIHYRRYIYHGITVNIDYLTAFGYFKGFL